MPTKRRAASDGPLAQFFSQYPSFKYDHTKGPTKELHRLFRRLHLDSENKERKPIWRAFNDAIALEFNDAFGTDEDSLASWQALCQRLRIDPIPNALNECREVVKNTHVNLVDLVDRNEQDPMKFETVDLLKQYSLEQHKIFPKENAYAGGLLKNLLREFFNVHEGSHSRGRRGS